jgi:hypothetical protein
MALLAQFARSLNDPARPDEFCAEHGETEQNDERTRPRQKNQQQAEEDDCPADYRYQCPANGRIHLIQPYPLEKFLERMHPRQWRELYRRAMANRAFCYSCS